jgi:hypothetical protein
MAATFMEPPQLDPAAQQQAIQDNTQPADLFRLLDANSERMIDFGHLKEFA